MLIDLPYEFMYKEDIEGFISRTYGMKNYQNQSEKIQENEESFDNMSREEKIEILRFLHSEEDAYGEDITYEEEAEAWEKVCDRFSINERNLIELLPDMDLVKESYTY